MKKILIATFALSLLYSCKSKTDWREKYREEQQSKHKTPEKNWVENTSSSKIKTMEDIANIIDVSHKTLKNKELYHLIIDWYATPYRFGGSTKNGIDCSGFTKMLYKEVYKKDLPRTSKEMGNLIKRQYTKDLKEGDLVFFSFGNSKEINHVGVYLHNNKFVHASTKKGVIISDITEPWYGNHLIKCGPIIE